MSHPGEENGSERPPVLVADGLKKSYGHALALKGLSFSLERGRILGFLGPNGAGKTTAIRILTTILEPSSGRFSIDGVGSENAEEIRRRFGVLPESLGFPKHISPLDYLTYFGRLYGLGAEDSRARARALVTEVGLAERARSLVGTFSRGMRQRLGIARALIHDPAVVILDEPTLGLDPRGQRELLALVRRIADERGASVILCSHLLAEVEEVCDDVIILNRGEVVARGSVTDVLGLAPGGEGAGAAVRVKVPRSFVDGAERQLAALADVVSVSSPPDGAGWLRVELSVNGDPEAQHRVKNGVLDCLIRAEIPVLNFEAANDRLQDVFLRLTEEITE